MARTLYCNCTCMHECGPQIYTYNAVHDHTNVIKYLGELVTIIRPAMTVAKTFENSLS